MEAKLANFDAPTPGMSLTGELGGRPWQRPPQLTTVDEVIEHYTTRITTDEFSDQLLDVMGMGVPLTIIANTMQLSGVMEGKHTADTGLLALPVIIESMMLIGDTAGVEYKTGLDDKPRNERDTLAKKSVDKFIKEEKEGNVVPEEEPEEQNETEEVVGLMSRRV